MRARLVLAGCLVRVAAAHAAPGPEPPSIESGPRTFVAFAGQPARIELAWPEAHGVARYRARWTAAGAQVDIELPGTATTFERAESTAGHHQLSLVAIDDRGHESPPAEIGIDIVTVIAIAPGASEPAPPTASAFALGTRFASPGLRCRLGDGPAGEDIAATTIGAMTLACGGEAGQPHVAVPIVIAPVIADAPSVPIARGVATTVHVTLACVAPIGDRLEVSAIGDLDLGDAVRTSGGFDVRITPLRGANDIGLVIRGNGVELGRVALAAIDAPPPPGHDAADWYALDAGGQLGLLVLPSVGPSASALGRPTDPRDALTSGPLVGGRLGLFPIPSVGIEAEAALAVAGYEGFPGITTLALARAQLAARLIEDGRYGLRLLGGAGVLGVLLPSATSHRGAQGEVHWGGAFSIEARENLWVRVEALHVITSAQNAGYAHCVELQVGLVTRFGRRDGVRAR